jgi:hypothetical protein
MLSVAALLASLLSLSVAEDCLYNGCAFSLCALISSLISSLLFYSLCFCVG